MRTRFSAPDVSAALPSDVQIERMVAQVVTATSQMPVQAPGETAHEGDHITMHYKYSHKTGNYTQHVLVNGKHVSELSTKDAHAQGWGSAVECAEDNCGTMGAHSWIDVTITMDQPDPTYIQTLNQGAGVTGDLITNDGGKTWTVAKIGIPAFTFSS